MRIRRRTPRRIFLLSLPGFLLLLPAPALSQNLLVNPGFERDLSGWTVATSTSPGTYPPGYVEASVTWDEADFNGRADSGGTGLHAVAGTYSTATATVGQCLPVPSGSLVTFGARFLTRRQRASATGQVRLEFFLSTDCSGGATGPLAIASLPYGGPVNTNSGGRWDIATSTALVPAFARSARIAVLALAIGDTFYGGSYVDTVADDAFLTVASSQQTVSLLPSAAWVSGAGGAYWTTQMSLVNPGSSDAAVTFKWLGHDADGRGGAERAYLVRAGQTLELSEEEWEINHPQSYGAILVTSSSPSLFLQSETSTPVAGGGTVGQALPAFGPADFATSTPKTLAPIRDNASFRTNLVLANPTEIPVTAHVALFAADGTPLGSRDVDLPPLGMTQINRVASELGATTLDLGRISVSTSTPGGLVAAYASVIDNVTNDPRTLLPR